MKKKVIIIGSGERVQGALLPALWCLQETHEVLGVAGRLKKEIRLMNGALEFTTNPLHALPLKDADLILVAVSKKQVPQVLRELAATPLKETVLLLDTPVLPPSGLASMRHFSNFKRVLVTEDTIALPPFIRARTLINEGAIGTLKTIYFFHNGYAYHASASLKMLANDTHISELRSRKFYNGRMRKDFLFRNGVRGVLYEPRDYEKGHFLIEGTKGVIADYDYRGGPHHRISYRMRGPLYDGLTHDGTILPDTPFDTAFKTHMTDDVPLLSLMQGLKIRALLDIVHGATEEKSPFHYAPIEGLLDALLMRVSEKIGFALDPRI